REGSIIDTTMIKVGDWYYRASGDGEITIERSRVIETPTVSPTAQETGTDQEWVLVGTLQSILDGSGDCSGGTNYTGACLQGPEFFEFNADDTPEGTDVYGLLADQYAAGPVTSPSPPPISTPPPPTTGPRPPTWTWGS